MSSDRLTALSAQLVKITDKNMELPARSSLSNDAISNFTTIDGLSMLTLLLA